MVVLLSYHRRPRMISEALELRVEDGWGSHSWCLFVVGDGYGGLSRGSGWCACGTKPGWWVARREMPEHFQSATWHANNTRSHRLPSWLGRSSWKGLNTGGHEKAPLRCPCCRLATLHGAPRRQMELLANVTNVECRSFFSSVRLNVVKEH